MKKYLMLVLLLGLAIAVQSFMACDDDDDDDDDGAPTIGHDDSNGENCLECHGGHNGQYANDECLDCHSYP